MSAAEYDARRQHALDLAVSLRTTLSAEELYLVQQFLEPMVRDADYPALTTVLVPETDEALGYRKIVCPHCGIDLADAGGSEYLRLSVIDVAYRSTSMLQDPDGANEVYAHYDGSGDYESLVYACAVCARPVCLPEGWTEA